MNDIDKSLVQDVVAILRSRGIEATPLEVSQWAEEMTVQFKESNPGSKVTPDHWLLGVKRNIGTPTMCLHIRFGDSREGGA